MWALAGILLCTFGGLALYFFAGNGVLGYIGIAIFFVGCIGVVTWAVNEPPAHRYVRASSGYTIPPPGINFSTISLTE
jgi:hypothetical protein